MVVVVGKGGVGRSTTAAALAIEAATGGRSVLLVDATADGGAAAALGMATSPPLGQATVVDGPWSGGGGSSPDDGAITLLELGTEASLDEYLRMNLRVPIAPRSLGPIARLFDFVATAAPAVVEILTIGKIGHEVRNGPWDLVVVDGPATGHVVELLSAPVALGELVGVGPLASDTAWLSDLLADPETTVAVAVALAEELPVSETIELIERIEAESAVSVAGLVVNRLPPALSPAGEREAAAIVDTGDPSAGLAAIAVERHRVAVRELARLEAALDLPTVLVAEDLADPTAAAVAALSKVSW